MFQPLEHALSDRRELVGNPQSAFGPLVSLKVRCGQTQSMCGVAIEMKRRHGEAMMIQHVQQPTKQS